MTKLRTDEMQIKRWKSEVGRIVCQCGNPISIERINDYWITKLFSLRKEDMRVIKEMVEKIPNVVIETQSRSGELVTTTTLDILSALSTLEREGKAQVESKYECIDGKPKWVTYENGVAIKEERYDHQDGNFSKLCTFQYCRCQS